MAVSKVRIKKSAVDTQEDGKYTLELIWELSQSAGGTFSGTCVITVKDETSGTEMARKEEENVSYCILEDLELISDKSYSATVTAVEGQRTVASQPIPVHCESVKNWTCEMTEQVIRCSWDPLPVSATHLVVREIFGLYRKSISLHNPMFGCEIPLNVAGILEGTSGVLKATLHFVDSGEENAVVVCGPEVESPRIYPQSGQIEQLVKTEWSDGSLLATVKLALPYEKETVPVQLAIVEGQKPWIVSGTVNISAGESQGKFLFSKISGKVGNRTKFLFGVVLGGEGFRNAVMRGQFLAPSGRLRNVKKERTRDGVRICFQGDYMEPPVGYAVTCGQKTWDIEEESLEITGLTVAEQQLPATVVPRFAGGIMGEGELIGNLFFSGFTVSQRSGEETPRVGIAMPGTQDKLSLRLCGTSGLLAVESGPFSLKEGVLTISQETPVTYGEYIKFLNKVEGNVTAGTLYQIMEAAARSIRVPAADQLLFACHFNPEARSIQLSDGMFVQVESQAFKIRNGSEEKFIPGYLPNETARYAVHCYENKDGSRYFLHLDSFVDRLAGHLVFRGYDEANEEDPAAGGLIDTFKTSCRFPFMKIQYPDGFFDSSVDMETDPIYYITFTGSNTRSDLDAADYLEHGFYFRGRSTVTVLFAVLVNGHRRLVPAGTSVHSLLAEYGCHIGNLKSIRISRRLPDVAFVDADGNETSWDKLPVYADTREEKSWLDQLLLMMGDEIDFT